jgi:hypothetical protein
MLQMRRLDIIWTGKDVQNYDKLKRKAKKLQKEMPVYVKKVLEKAI